MVAGHVLLEGWAGAFGGCRLLAAVCFCFRVLTHTEDLRRAKEQILCVHEAFGRHFGTQRLPQLIQNGAKTL
jgi:hypothetical protein